MTKETEIIRLLNEIRKYDVDGDFEKLTLESFRIDEFSGVIGTFINNFPTFFPVSTYPRYQLALSQPNCTNWELGKEFNTGKTAEVLQEERSKHTEMYWNRTLGDFINDIREALLETSPDGEVNWEVTDEVDQYLLYMRVAYSKALNFQELDVRDRKSLEHLLSCYKHLRKQGYSNYDLTG